MILIRSVNYQETTDGVVMCFQNANSATGSKVPSYLSFRVPCQVRLVFLKT